MDKHCNYKEKRNYQNLYVKRLVIWSVSVMHYPKQASRPIKTPCSLLYGTDKGRRTVIYQVQIVLL